MRNGNVGIRWRGRGRLEGGKDRRLGRCEVVERTNGKREAPPPCAREHEYLLLNACLRGPCRGGVGVLPARGGPVAIVVAQGRQPACHTMADRAETCCGAMVGPILGDVCGGRARRSSWRPREYWRHRFARGPSSREPSSRRPQRARLSGPNRCRLARESLHRHARGARRQRMQPPIRCR